MMNILNVFRNMIGRVTRHYLRGLYAQEYEEYHWNML